MIYILTHLSLLQSLLLPSPYATSTAAALDGFDLEKAEAALDHFKQRVNARPSPESPPNPHPIHSRPIIPLLDSSPTPAHRRVQIYTFEVPYMESGVAYTSIEAESEEEASAKLLAQTNDYEDHQPDEITYTKLTARLYATES